MELPSEHALSSLPRWALVAFAARCSRRAEPLFHKAWPAAPHRVVMAVRGAVEYAEQAAAGASSQKDIAQHHARAADQAAEQADSTSQAVAEGGAYYAAHAAANAVGAVAYEKEAVAAAYYAASDASQAMAAIAGGGNDSILADLELLNTLAREHGWTDETPIPPDVFSLRLEQDVGEETGPERSHQRTAGSGVSEDVLARCDAYYSWVRAGRPSLSKEQQDRVYFEALERIRRNREV